MHIHIYIVEALAQIILFTWQTVVAVPRWQDRHTGKKNKQIDTKTDGMCQEILQPVQPPKNQTKW